MQSICWRCPMSHWHISAVLALGVAFGVFAVQGNDVITLGQVGAGCDRDVVAWLTFLWSSAAWTLFALSTVLRVDLPLVCSQALFTQDAQAALHTNLHANPPMLLASCVNIPIASAYYEVLRVLCEQGLATHVFVVCCRERWYACSTRRRDDRWWSYDAAQTPLHCTGECSLELILLRDIQKKARARVYVCLCPVCSVCVCVCVPAPCVCMCSVCVCVPAPCVCVCSVCVCVCTLSPHKLECWRWHCLFNLLIAV